MANQLIKLADAVYSPGTPYQPAQPAYCYWTVDHVPGYWTYGGTTTWVKDPQTGEYVAFTSYTPVWQPATETPVQVCVPGTPAVPGVPAVTSYTGIAEWNAGGRSVEGLAADGFFQFKLSAGTVATAIGLVLQNVTTKPNEASHAFYVHEDTVDIIESGTVVVADFAPHDPAAVFRIERSGTTVTYRHDGNTYVSLVPAVDTVFLDAAIYYLGDSVYDPEIGTLVDNEGEAYGTFRAMDGLASNYDYGVDGGYGQAYGYFKPMTGAATADNINVGVASGTFEPLTGLAANYAYAEAHGSFAALTGEADGGFVVPEFSYAYGVMAPLSGNGLVYVGVYGVASGTFARMDGLAANFDYNYGQASGSLKPMTGFGFLTTPEEDLPVLRQGLAMFDSYFAPMTMSASFMEGLELGTSFFANIVVADAISDALVLQTSLSFSQVVQALINSGLAIVGDTDAAQRAAVQYAINVLTGAVTTYNGFDFLGYAKAGTNVYAYKPDGVYLLRAGDDDGLPIEIDIDFGTSSYGAATLKNVEDVYFGLATDGEVYMRANTDGVEHTYHVIDRGATMRALMARGVSGRRWNLALEVVDATEFELDLVEVRVSTSRRRRAK